MENTGRDTLNYAHENVVENLFLLLRNVQLKNLSNHNKILLTQKLFYTPTI